jgi:hypothetical protein
MYDPVAATEGEDAAKAAEAAEKKEASILAAARRASDIYTRLLNLPLILTPLNPL